MLSENAISDRAVRVISETSSLVNLNLADTRITDACSEAIGRLGRLRNLIVSDTHIGDAFLKNISHLRLEHVVLSRTHVTGCGLAFVPRTVTELFVEQLRLGPSGLTRLPELEHLWFLQANGTPLSDSQLRCLQQQRRLTYLHVADTGITGTGLVHLANLPRLAVVDLSGCPVSQQGIEALAALPHLEFCILRNCDLRECDVPTGPEFWPDLRGVDLAGARVSVDAITAFAQCRQLRRINLEGLPFSDAEWEHILASFRNAEIIR
ncbi:MAG: hypothetical protein GXP27_05295 [Planctomycetes bacterium]|nr:hypothetical protein [Planctomycetota bacterium]